MKNPLPLRHYAVCVMFCFLTLISTTSFSQQTLTSVNGWNAYVHLPWDYNANPTKKYPTIIFIPGLGEIGTNASAVIANGPGAYIKQGWNGNVKVGNSDSVKFIIISLQPPAAWPGASTVKNRIDLLKSQYRMSDLFMTGLSMGGWASMTYATAYPTELRNIVSVEGVDIGYGTDVNQLWKDFSLSGGKMANFEQINDYRLGDIAVAAMNNWTPGSAEYVETNFGGGGHCCWSQFYGGGGTIPNKFNVNGQAVNVYEWIALHSSEMSAMPVTMDYFNAKADKNDVLLEWHTASESNSSHFEIQKSSDGQNYQKIATVKAAGNSNAIKQYYYRDDVPLKGNNFYRLKMVDLDGSNSLSKTVSVQLKDAPGLVLKSAIINRTSGKVNMEINSATENAVQISITDVTGRTYYRQQQQIVPGSNVVSEQISLPSTGIYYLRVSTGSDFITKALFSN